MSKNLTIQTVIKLNNGVLMPIFGLGTYLANSDGNAFKAVEYAIKEQNYRHIDTAEFYENEDDVGKGVKLSGVPREEIFITSKLFTTSGGRRGCIETFNQAMRLLDVKYIDQYLLHAPQGGKVLECYDALLEFHKQGILRSVGVSNFGIKHLEAIRASGRPMPSVNQIELHPWCLNEDIVNYCIKYGIVVVGYSPLSKSHKLKDPYANQLAKKYNKTPAQILIRWSLQKGFVTIPKSSKPERIAENANVFDFSLSDDEMATFESFGRKQKESCTWDPTRNSMSEFGPTK